VSLAYAGTDPAKQLDASLVAARNPGFVDQCCRLCKPARIR
jgi:hypothetical protein